MVAIFWFIIAFVIVVITAMTMKTMMMVKMIMIMMMLITMMMITTAMTGKAQTHVQNYIRTPPFHLRVWLTSIIRLPCAKYLLIL